MFIFIRCEKTTLDGTATATTSKDGASVKPNVPNQKQAEADKTIANTQSALEKPKEESNNNSFLLIVLVIAGVGVTLYYFLVMKRRKRKRIKMKRKKEWKMDSMEIVSKMRERKTIRTMNSAN